MPVRKVLDEMESKMNKSLEFLKSEFLTVHTGKASSALVENIKVDYYGTPTRLKELAGITTPEPRLIVIQPWDVAAAAEVDKAIKKANIGFNPIIDGKLVRIRIPELSEERRKDLDKVAKRMTEEARVAIRSERRHANEQIKALEKSHEITEDDMFKNEKIVQDKTNNCIKQIDEMLAGKEEEILQV
ncbi:MAG: ribosome recycling factor [Candidatus Ancaeobacter aquaticus]|nr:ribosome recycling factor [Candidatus Ancaeobacter aquaticus]